MKKNYILLLFVLVLSYSASAQLIINEVLYDPPSGEAGDANGDGTRSSMEDEFIEFINNSTTSLDVSGYMIFDFSIEDGTKTLRHTIPDNTVLPANGVLIVFGGGTPTGSFGGATVVTDTGSAGLSLQNSGEKILIEDASGTQILEFDSDALSNNPDESYTRDPDITGDFVQHASIDSANGALFSPGTKVDGTALSVNTFAKNELSIFPNPANNGVVNITSPLAGDKTIAMYDITGRLVKQAVLTSETLDVQALAAGMYVLKISIEDKSSTTKLLIQ